MSEIKVSVSIDENDLVGRGVSIQVNNRVFFFGVGVMENE